MLEAPAFNLSFFLLPLTFIFAVAFLYVFFSNKKINNRIHFKRVALELDQSCWCAFDREGELCYYSPYFKEEFLLPDLERFSSFFKNKQIQESFFLRHQNPKSPDVFMHEFKHGNEKIFKMQAKWVRFKKPYFLILLNDVTLERKAIESCLRAQRQAEQKYALLKDILDAIPLPIWYRSDVGKIDFCNKAYADSVGKSLELIYEKNIDLFSRSSENLSMKKISQEVIRTGELQSYDVHAVMNRSRKKIAVTEQASMRGLIGFALDQTKEQQLHDVLQQHVRAHHEVLEHLSTAIAVYDADQKLSFFNNAYCRLCGGDEVWLSSKPSYAEVLDRLRQLRMLPEEADFQAYKKRHLDRFTSLMAPLHYLDHLPNDQTLRILFAPYPMGGLLLMIEDVTNTLTLERRFNTLIAVQKETLDHLHEGVAVFASDNRLKLCNPTYARMWQLSKASVTPGRHISNIVDDMRSLYKTQDWSGYKAGLITQMTDRESKVGQIERADGSVLRFTYVPLPDGGHQLSYLDVTDSYNMEKMLVERNEVLRAIDHLKSEFVAHVSYELRSPLNTIVGFSEILINQYYGALNEKQSEYVAGVLESSKQLLNLINQILDLASIEAGQLALEPQPLMLRPFLQKVSNQLRVLASERGHDLELECDEDLGVLTFDERRLAQVLYNLGSNAIKFTPHNGAIRIKARYEDGHVVIEVEDNGVGIAKEDQLRLFEKFARITPGRESGAGLGLVLVKNLIELHKGRIEINSQENKGTTVRCYLPVVA